MSQSNLYKDILIERDRQFFTSDGTNLSCDVYRPNVDNRLPALLIRVPYNKYSAQAYTLSHPIWYARHGYVVVTQDTRGRYKSGGDFYPFRNDALDGYETIEWVAQLPFCNGKVGTYGYSYGGMNQLLTAALQPPSLCAAVPAFTGSDQYHNWNYCSGAFSLGFNAWWSLFLALDGARRQGNLELENRVAAASKEFPGRYWTLPIGELFPSEEFKNIAPYFYDWLDNPTRNDYWRKNSVQENYSKINTPCLHLSGWYDTFVEGLLRNYQGIKQNFSPTNATISNRLIVGPWYHMPWSIFVGSVDFGSEAINILDEYILEWFDYWLKGIPGNLEVTAPVKLFVMGENKWRDADDWPPTDALDTKFFLHSRGRANSISGNGWIDQMAPEDEDPDIFIYDPNDPIISRGGRSCCVPEVTPMGPYDQRLNEIRNDVLVFSTKPLEKALEVTGYVSLVLWASSTAVDTDFTAKLIDVFPDGRAINLCDGLVRARFRNSFVTPELIEPNRIYQYEIKIGATSNLFKPGHSIRLEISSSNFPAYDRNPNGPGWSTLIGPLHLELATQIIFHDNEHPSHVILPICARD